MNALMNPSAPLTMSSQEIAALVESRHDSVKRSVERLMERGVIQHSPLVEVLNAQGQTVSVYQLAKRDTYIVVAQMCPEFTARLVDRWQELEAQQAKPASHELSRMEILQIAMQAEQERLIAIEQRDEAIRTKAEIGSRREATAMATASAKAREVERLKEELGRNQAHATVKVVEKMTRKAYDWRPLKKYCADVGLQPRKVVDEQYGTVNARPAIAWRNVHGVDLEMLFPSERDA